MTGVSDRAEFCEAVLSTCPMYDNVTSSQSFHPPHAGGSRLARLSHTYGSISPVKMWLSLGSRVSGQRLQLGRQSLILLLCIHPCSALVDDVGF